jgi:uncharacterized protein YcaQ
MPGDSLSLDEARRIALAAQGFGTGRPAGAVTDSRLARMLDRIGVLQIDSVNVLVRSHYLPLFSRLGPYPAERLDRRAYGRQPRRLFEYWGHAASLLPVERQPLFRWRMERAVRNEKTLGGLARFGRDNKALIAAVLSEVAARGPLGASELTDGGRGTGAWWGWSKGKAALEWLFWAGHVTTASRRNFERLYDLPDRVLPKAILEAPTPSEDDALRRLIELSARALGVATEADLKDYFRLRGGGATARLAELVEAKTLKPVRVEGWREPAFLHAEAKAPRRIEARALLSPFDSLVWHRPRAERLFDFRYRIGLYTPKGQRSHGYYVLPFLLGDRLVGRVDLKADRKSGALRVEAAYAELGIRETDVVEPLAEELDLMRSWLGLDGLRVSRKGDLARALGSYRQRR